MAMREDPQAPKNDTDDQLANLLPSSPQVLNRIETFLFLSLSVNNPAKH